MSKYYIYQPRNFGNEYTAIVVKDNAEEARLNDWYNNLNSHEGKNLYRVTVKELREMVSTEKHARKYDQAFSGYCNPEDPMTVDEFLVPCW